MSDPANARRETQLPRLSSRGEGRQDPVHRQAPARQAETGVPSVTGRGAGGLPLIDVINELARISLLFLKPGYIPPNLVGQAALLAIEQGPKTAINLVTAQTRLMASCRGRAPLDAGGHGEGLGGAVTRAGAAPQLRAPSAIHGAHGRGLLADSRSAVAGRLLLVSRQTVRLQHARPRSRR